MSPSSTLRKNFDADSQALSILVASQAACCRARKEPVRCGRKASTQSPPFPDSIACMAR